MSELKMGTKCVQGGYTPGNGEPRQVPIIQSTTFKYATSEDMGKLFDLEASGYFYTRLQNPTNDTVAAKIAELEGGSAAMLTSSGQAANFFAVFNIASCGDHVVASSSIYGKADKLRGLDKREMLFIALSGLATGGSWLCYYKALQDGPASVVVPIDKLSILVSILFSYIVFHEKLTKRSAAGLAILVAGTLLMLVG